MESIDSGKITILTALDMSAAFDTLDHITLLHRLQHTFGLSGYAISWIRSYLTERSSFAKIDSSSSHSTTILTGVPQGSVLGPLLFVLFISPIANVINPDQSSQNNTVSFHQYADDTQLYINTNSSTLTTQIASIESCTQRVHNLHLNNEPGPVASGPEASVSPVQLFGTHCLRTFELQNCRWNVSNLC